MDTVTKYRLHDSLGYRLTYVARLNERSFEALLAPTGLTRLGWCALTAIGHEGLTRPSDIADFIGVDRTALSRMLGRLEREGLVARALDAADGRGRRLRLTDAGATALAAATEAAEVNAAHFAARLSDADHALLNRLLDRLMTEAAAPLSGL